MPDETLATPAGLCQCGCGGTTSIANRTDAQAGVVKGRPRRFLNGHGGNRGNRLGASHKTRKHAIAHEAVDWGYGTECWRWLGFMMKNGYGSLKLGRQNLLAHRYYYEQHKGAIPAGFEIDHLCRNRSCVNPDHLEAVTPHVNKLRSASTKLSAAQVAEIRARTGQLHREMAAEFGVDQSTISLIRAGKSRQID